MYMLDNWIIKYGIPSMEHIIYPIVGAHSRWTDWINEWMNISVQKDGRSCEPICSGPGPFWQMSCYFTCPIPPSSLCNCTFPLVNCLWCILCYLREIDSQVRPIYFSLLRCWILRRVEHRGGNGRSPGLWLVASWETITSYDPNPQGYLTYSSSQHLITQLFWLLSLPVISPINPYCFA